jgi:hypothetical protein
MKLKAITGNGCFRWFLAITFPLWTLPIGVVMLLRDAFLDIRKLVDEILDD